MSNTPNFEARLKLKKVRAYIVRFRDLVAGKFVRDVDNVDVLLVGYKEVALELVENIDKGAVIDPVSNQAHRTVF